MGISTKVGIILGLAAMAASADTIVLKSGETIQGTFLGGTARQIRMDLGGDVRTYDIDRVQSINFDAGFSQQAPPPPARDRDRDRDRGAFNNAPPPAPGGYGPMIPADTSVTIRMIDSVDSERAVLGQTFRASLDEPIVVNGQELIPRGADVLTKLVADQKSGKIEGRTVLTMAISTITVNGRPVDVTSSDVQTASSSRGARSAKVIGGTAALGAVIGAIAGGGKGAAIGAGSGAALGTGAEVLTGGQKVKIPSETRLTFRLQNPVQL
jgi:hypothetical protein